MVYPAVREGRMSATEVVLCQLSNATQIQRLTAENFLAAVLRNIHVAHLFEIKPEHKQFIAIVPNRHNPPSVEVLSDLQHALESRAAVQLIAFQNEKIGFIASPTQGIRLPGLIVTAMHPELLVHALRKELEEGVKNRESGEEQSTTDPGVWAALPSVIRDNWKYFSDKLIKHINETTVVFLKKHPNNSVFFSKENIKHPQVHFPKILVQFKDKKLNDDAEPMDLMHVLVSPNISRKSFKLLVPATNTAASIRARKTTPSTSLTS